MKVLPLSVVVAAVFAGGAATGRWFWPAAPPVPGGVSQNGGAAMPGADVMKMENGAPRPVFDGTLESLRAIAKASHSPSRADRQLLAALDAASAGQVAALMAAFPWKSTLPWEENAVHSALLETWTEMDAGAALRWAATLPLNRQRPVRSSIFATLGQVDLPKALELANGIKNPSERNELLRSLAMQQGLTDPQAALRLTAGLGRNGQYTASTILSRWAERDPLAAWAATLAMPSSQRNNCQQNVLGTWAANDSAAALAAAQGLPAGSRRTYALSAVFGGWARTAPAAAFTAADSVGNPAERKAARWAALNAWANTDAAAALKATDAISSRRERTQSQLSVLESWGRNDPQAAAAAAGNLPLNRNERSNFYSNIVNGWGQSDPQGAMTWARSLPERESRYLVSNLLENMAGTDPEAATAIWKSLPRSQQRSSVSSLASAWAQNDMDGALGFARSLDNPQERNQALNACAGALNFEQPEKIAAVFAGLPAGPSRAEAMRRFVSNRSQQGESAEVMAWMRALPEQDRSAILNGFNGDDENWNGQGSEAKDWVAMLKDTSSTLPPQAMRRLAAAMSQEDPAAAMEWAGSLEDAVQRQNALRSAISEWAQEKPLEAMGAAQALPEGQARTEAMKSVIQNWSYQDPEALLAWAATATGAERENALITGGLAKAEYDPAAGAKIVEQFLRPQNGEKTTSAVNNAAATVAGGWFSQNMEKGIAWVSALPESEARETAVSTVVGQWTRLDPVAASEWVSQLPPGDSRDGAAATLASGIRQTDPERALAWAGSIASPTGREAAIVQTLESWRYQDKEAARAAAEKAAISDTARAAILEKIGKQ